MCLSPCSHSSTLWGGFSCCLLQPCFLLVCHAAGVGWARRRVSGGLDLSAQVWQRAARQDQQRGHRAAPSLPELCPRQAPHSGWSQVVILRSLHLLYPAQLLGFAEDCSSACICWTPLWCTLLAFTTSAELLVNLDPSLNMVGVVEHRSCCA